MAKAVVDALRVLGRSFGPEAALEKVRLLRALEPGRLSERQAGRLREVLGFLRAYPDGPAVRRAVDDVRKRLPPAPPVFYSFSWGTVQRLVRLLPGGIDIDFDEIEDETALADLLEACVLPGEAEALNDSDITLRDWFARARPEGATDLSLLVKLVEGSGLPATVQAQAYDRCDVPLRYDGPPSCDVEIPAGRTAWQRRPVERERFPLAPAIRRPPRVRRAGQAVVDASLQALCARQLEIYPLIHADPAAVRVVEGDRGMSVAFVGVRPEFRSALETLAFFLVVKNGVPIAYGPAGVFLGCCEMGINLFPEFRGGEIRRMYALVMRALHHLFEVEYFFLTRYGMGEDNPDAIRSGAFWFYRKLGFLPTSPDVEELARAEERKMARDPRYRSDRKMLRRLSHTEAYFDLSRGRCTPFPFSRLSLAETAWLGRHFDGDRNAAEATCARRVARLTGLKPTARALRAMAPILCMIPDLDRWPARDRTALARALRAKDAPWEATAAKLLAGHARLASALRGLAADSVRHG